MRTWDEPVTEPPKRTCQLVVQELGSSAGYGVVRTASYHDVAKALGVTFEQLERFLKNPDGIPASTAMDQLWHLRQQGLIGSGSTSK